MIKYFTIQSTFYLRIKGNYVALLDILDILDILCPEHIWFCTSGKHDFFFFGCFPGERKISFASFYKQLSKSWVEKQVCRAMLWVVPHNVVWQHMLSVYIWCLSTYVACQLMSVYIWSVYIYNVYLYMLSVNIYRLSIYQYMLPVNICCLSAYNVCQHMLYVNIGCFIICSLYIWCFSTYVVRQHIMSFNICCLLVYKEHTTIFKKMANKHSQSDVSVAWHWPQGKVIPPSLAPCLWCSGQRHWL